MISLIKYIAWISLLLFMNLLTANPTDPNKEITLLLENLSNELQEVQAFYETQNHSLKYLDLFRPFLVVS